LLQLSRGWGVIIGGVDREIGKDFCLLWAARAEARGSLGVIRFGGFTMRCALILFGLVFPFLGQLEARAADPALTIYNQDFAVVREAVPLDLAAGVNDVKFADTTAHLEPDSVVLRDPAGRRRIRIYEQNFRGDPVSSALLLNLYEGETIDFLVQRQDQEFVIPGKIIRSGYVPHYAAMQRYSQAYRMRQQAMASGHGQGQPIIEIEGKLRFGLPGTPLFPELTDESILKPTLHWQLAVDQPGRFDAELAYVTGGMRWDADYNIIAPEKGDKVDLVGWVTMDNQSGRTFENARIKLIAGDVNKIQDDEGGHIALSRARSFASENAATVTQKSFDEYHMYTLARQTTLRDRETKQVEFVSAKGVRADRIYVYDGAKINHGRYRGWSAENYRSQADYGTQSNPKVWVMLEFENSEDNGLGIPLPKGRFRFYRQDDDGLLEFTGEDMIDHTPKDETVRVYTGNAFDIVGERARIEFNKHPRRDELDESFRIKLRNHKDKAVEVRVVEHLYRWSNWEIQKASDDFVKTDSRTVEFRVALDPDEEKVITYTAHYWW
jgi:hypothetical protein